MKYQGREVRWLVIGRECEIRPVEIIGQHLRRKNAERQARLIERRGGLARIQAA